MELHIPSGQPDLVHDIIPAINTKVELGAVADAGHVHGRDF